jgi:hypothetical protein
MRLVDRNETTIQIVAFFDSLFMRLLGIGIASFSSGKRLAFYCCLTILNESQVWEN